MLYKFQNKLIDIPKNAVFNKDQSKFLIFGSRYDALYVDKTKGEEVDLESVALADLETFYRDAKKRFDDEEGFADKARDYVVKLQGGDAHCQKLWQLFIDTSVKHSIEVYDKLNVTLKKEDIKAESAARHLPADCRLRDRCRTGAPA